MTIRKSNDNDLYSIYALHMEAFGDSEGPVVAKLALDLWRDNTAKPIYSFVAKSQGKLIGHIIFSPIRIVGFEDISAFILAPLAVSKSHQKQGIGTQLIAHGLRELEDQGAEVVFVYGDPNYYRRSGFQAGHRISAPYRLECPEAWLAKELIIGVLSETEGVAKCASALMSQEYW